VAKILYFQLTTGQNVAGMIRWQSRISQSLLNDVKTSISTFLHSWHWLLSSTWAQVSYIRSDWVWLFVWFITVKYSSVTQK